jgi:hypothetical protein
VARSTAAEHEAVAHLAVVHHLLMILGPLCKKSLLCPWVIFDRTFIIVEQVSRGDSLQVRAQPGSVKNYLTALILFVF